MVDIKEKLRELGGTFILTLFAIAIIWITAYFDILLALPGFLASLFFIWAIPKARYSKFKNVIISYIVVIIFGFLTGFGVFQGFIDSMALPIETSIISLTLAIFLSAFITIIANSEHPPAIAALVFFAYSELTTTALIGFFISFAILVGVQAVIFAVKRIKGGGVGDLGGEDEESGLDDLGGDISSDSSDLGNDLKL